MKQSNHKLLIVWALALVISFALLTGCGAQSLSNDFNLEEVEKSAENVISLVNEEDSESIKALCNEEMEKALTDELLKEAYEVIAEGGKFEKIEKISVSGVTDEKKKQELAVAVIQAKYEKETFTYTISFDEEMKIAGLYANEN